MIFSIFKSFGEILWLVSLGMKTLKENIDFSGETIHPSQSIGGIVKISHLFIIFKGRDSFCKGHGGLRTEFTSMEVVDFH